MSSNSVNNRANILPEEVKSPSLMAAPLPEEAAPTAKAVEAAVAAAVERALRAPTTEALPPLPLLFDPKLHHQRKIKS